MKVAVLAGLFAAIGPSADAAQTYDPTTAQVIQADRDLQAAERQREYAEWLKSDAAKKAMSAKQRAEANSWFRRAKRRAKAIAAEAKANLKKAEANAQQKEMQYKETGINYLQAEDNYYVANGKYLNPQQYQAIKDRLHYESTVDPAAATNPDNAEAASKELTQRMTSGKPIGAGELAARASQLSKMGYGAIGKTLDMDFSAAGREPQGAKRPLAGPAAGAPSAAAPSRSDALRSETALLLRQPALGSDQAASKRFVAAGRDRLNLGDAEQALRAADEAIKRDPSNPAAWTLKAQALNKLRRFEEAEEAAQRAVDLDPNNAAGYRELTWAQLHNGKADEAAANVTRLIRLEPENAEAYLLRAFAYELKGDRERMLADLERAAALDPRFANPPARARAGQRLFDPESGDTDNLLQALPALPAPQRGSVVWLGVLILLGGVGLLAWKSAPTLLPRLKERFARARTVGAGKAASAPAPREEPDSGLLAGKYSLERIAGRGGMGRVWRALDTSLERRVAVKEMAPELASMPELKELYLKEARALAAIHHPNVVEIYEVLDLGTQVYLIIEWVSGKTLQQVLVEKRRLPLDTVKAVIAPVCDALAYAHSQGLVHRDLKPSNVMAGKDGSVKLMDFGIARAVGERHSVPEGEAAGTAPSVQHAARTRTIAGTPAYRPPEAEKGLISPAFDIFSLGVCVYELACGELPFGPDGLREGDPAPKPVSKLVPGLPEALDDLLARALDPDPARRPKDALVFKNALLRT
ncbi:MAG: protein kinase [Elusimicrobia bacterium]|nr:protein kinase [Elusimicrobiota bacterium]